MTRPRLMMFMLLTLAAIAAAGRVLFELGVAMVGGEVHSALFDAPVTWLLLGLGAVWVVAVGLAVRLWPPRWQARTPALEDVGPRSRHANKLLRGVNTALLVVAAASLLGCSSCAHDQRKDALRAQLTALNVARDTLIAVSDERQSQIVDDCKPPDCTAEIGKQRLADFRQRRTPIVEAFEAAYKAISTAALLNDAKDLGDVAEAVSRAVSLVQELRP